MLARLADLVSVAHLLSWPTVQGLGKNVSCKHSKHEVSAEFNSFSVEI